MRLLRQLFRLCVFLGSLLSFELAAQEPSERKPSIASQYAGDQGIENDPRVIFVEDFEPRDVDTIAKRWETARNRDVMSLSSDVPDGSSGKQSLLMTQLASTSPRALADTPIAFGLTTSLWRRITLDR